MTEEYKTKKCGSCRGFLKWCKKRRSTNSSGKPACERYEARTIEDVLRPRLPITGQSIPAGPNAQRVYREKYNESLI